MLIVFLYQSQGSKTSSISENSKDGSNRLTLSTWVAESIIGKFHCFRAIFRDSDLVHSNRGIRALYWSRRQTRCLGYERWTEVVPSTLVVHSQFGLKNICVELNIGLTSTRGVLCYQYCYKYLLLIWSDTSNKGPLWINQTLVRRSIVTQVISELILFFGTLQQQFGTYT